MATLRSPRLLLAVAALLLLGGYVGFWFYEAGLVRSGLAEWAAARRAEGFTVAYQGPQISGFPFRIAVHLDHPSVAAPDGRWRWSGAAAEAYVRPWAFRHVTVEPLGRQEVTTPGEGGPALLALEAASAAAVIDVDAAGRLEEGSLDAERLTLSGPAPAPALTLGSLHLALSGPSAAAAAAKGPALPPTASLAIKIGDLAVPGAGASPLGAKIASLEAQAQLRGPLAGITPMAALKAWRDAGGTLELTHMALSWGPLQLAGNATLALDPNLQPEGAGTGEISGYNETVDTIVGQGMMKPSDGGLVKAALGLLAHKPAEGGAKVLSVPLTIQRQTLYAGPFGLIRLPTIKWAG